MVISRCKMGSEIKTEVVVAIVAALAEVIKGETKQEIRPYVRRKNRGWKEIALQENNFVVHFLRR